MRSKGFDFALVRRAVSQIVISLVAVSLMSPPANAAITQNGNNSANPTTAGADPIIGISDIGRLTVTAGSGVTSDVVILGDLVTGMGLVTITDFNSTTGTASSWTTNSLMVGDAGVGRLEILAGAIVTVDYAGNPGVGDFVVGNTAESVGTVIVNGLGSMLRLGDDSVIGQLGTGTLRIENEAYVVGTNGALTDTDIFTIGLHGRLELASGGRLRTELFTNHGAVVGSGRLDNGGTIANSPTGHIDVSTGDRLVVNAVVDNDGAISLNGGEIEFFKAVTNSGAAAELTLRDHGVARFPITGFGFDSTAGVIATTAGTNDIYGTVRIQTASSKISVSGGSTAVFHDPVTNAGGTIEVFAGSTIVYLQGLATTGSSSVMSVALSDPDTTAGAGAIEVSDGATLSGGVKVNLAAGYTPSAGDAFSIVSGSGGISGSLNLLSAPALPGGMQWDLDVTSSNVMLSVVATGDYDGSGIVDTGDYLVWSLSRNQQGSGLAADSNGDGFVNTADYNFWLSHFGNVVPASLLANVAVPEPAGCVLICAAGLTFSTLRRRRK